MEFAKIKYPQMREELIAHLLGLYKFDSLVKGVDFALAANVNTFDLDEFIHFLYDDTKLAEDSASCVGWFLMDLEEASIVGGVVEKLDLVFALYGVNAGIEEYSKKPEWGDVVQAIKVAIDHFLKSPINLKSNSKDK